jgi:hypothetical protein
VLSRADCQLIAAAERGELDELAAAVSAGFTVDPTPRWELLAAALGHAAVEFAYEGFEGRGLEDLSHLPPAAQAAVRRIWKARAAASVERDITSWLTLPAPCFDGRLVWASAEHHLTNEMRRRRP